MINLSQSQLLPERFLSVHAAQVSYALLTNHHSQSATDEAEEDDGPQDSPPDSVRALALAVNGVADLNGKTIERTTLHYRPAGSERPRCRLGQGGSKRGEC
jgi:hypothetical protein